MRRSNDMGSYYSKGSTRTFYDGTGAADAFLVLVARDETVKATKG